MTYSTKNRSFASFVFFLLFFFSCKKEKQDVLHAEISSPTSYQLSCIKFATDSIGFACGGSQFSKSEIIRTWDGGQSWHTVPLPQNIEEKQLYAIDALPSGLLGAVGFGGVTYYSDSFGQNIKFRQEPSYESWRSICFRTKVEATLCGQNDIRKGLINTSSFLQNWRYDWSDQIFTFGMYHITFPDSMTGYIAGFGAIIKTTDGGKNWEFTTAKNDYFTATEWFSATEGVAIGWEGSILKTTNGGKDWERIRNANKVAQKKIYLKSLAKNADNELIAVGEKGCILYSNDKGRNWKEIETFTDTNFESVDFRDDNTFFVVGDEGRIFKVEL